MEPAAPAKSDTPRSDAEIGRLTRDLADSIEQQAATSEVLQAIGRTASDLQAVFDTVLRHAVRLCAADTGFIHLLDGDVYRVAAALGGSDEYRRYLEEHPIARGHGTLVGRVGLERKTVQIRDAATDPQYEWHTGRRLAGFHTMLGVPMLVEDRVLGVLGLWRSDVDPFDERSIRLVTTLAAHGAIAIQNVRFRQELERRGAELARSVDELGALGEVSQAVNSSLDVDEVLHRVLEHAVELTGADGGSVFELEPRTGEFSLRTCRGTGADLAEALRAVEIRLGETLIGRAAIDGELRQAPDLEREPPDPHVEELLRHGWRSMVVVPLRREHEIMGALVVRRRAPGAFPDKTMELLQTLADQSAVAIVNARVYRELAEKTRQLEVASAHKSEFLASMSHELRTPLNAVIGFSDVLLDGLFGELNERQDEYLHDIRDAGRHLLELINEILDLSRVEAGRMELERRAISLPDLLAQGLAMVRERAQRHGIALALDVSPDVGVVPADELKLKQVVLNLLSNAVKFTPEGGSVSVTARLDGGQACVSVHDTGAGIAAAEQEAIFEAFQRGGRGARDATEGTGLGLTLSRRIVELHGGRLWLQESALGHGSTFCFAIPLHAEALEPERPAALEPGESGGPVLVVEDDRRSADLLRLHLERAGYAVAVAGDGVAGLDMVGRLHPRAVVLDVLLPGLGGWDLLTRLKGDHATAAIPVIVVSILDEREAGYALGAAEYLVKPVDGDELLAALARVAAPGGRSTVVAIDDDPRQLELIDAVLTPKGWSVARADGGAEGLRLVRQLHPAVVLLDLLMGEPDGFQVVERIRADPALLDVPIVVLTAKEMTRADQERLKGRISHLAHKGAFTPAQLAELVGRIAVPAPAGGVA
jgi:signal transduction histidine kinase/CheY-like chemotaxis protein